MVRNGVLDNTRKVQGRRNIVPCTGHVITSICNYVVYLYYLWYPTSLPTSVLALPVSCTYSPPRSFGFYCGEFSHILRPRLGDFPEIAIGGQKSARNTRCPDGRDLFLLPRRRGLPFSLSSLALLRSRYALLGLPTANLAPFVASVISRRSRNERA